MAWPYPRKGKKSKTQNPHKMNMKYTHLWKVGIEVAEYMVLSLSKGKFTQISQCLHNWYIAHIILLTNVAIPTLCAHETLISNDHVILQTHEISDDHMITCNIYIPWYYTTTINDT